VLERHAEPEPEGAVGLDAATESGRAVEDGAADGLGDGGAADDGCHVQAREDLEEEIYGDGRRRWQWLGRRAVGCTNMSALGRRHGRRILSGYVVPINLGQCFSRPPGKRSTIPGCNID
jgi:hypothetical protein